MRRRGLLACVAAGVGGVAGCLDGSGRVAAPTDSPAPTDASSSSPARSSTPGPTGHEFVVLEAACGTGENSASVARDGDVTVRGTIDGSNACYTARLAAVEYDRSADRLTVAVEAYKPDDAEMCATCIVDIEYEATIGFSGDLPETVVVTHDGETVTRA